MTKGRLLIVDDEPDMLENCTRILGKAGYECLTVSDPLKAVSLLESERPDLLLTDLRMPGVDGLGLLRQAHQVDPHMPVIILTAFASIESAVEAVKEGAFDYVPKPFSVDQLKLAVDRALAQRRLAVENVRLREQLRGTYGFENIIGRSPAMAQVFELVRKAARSEANILIVGESGTGKELVANAIHVNSPRAAEAFVPVDCASLPEQLLESELFGHEKGAFTGAVRTKPGLIEVAHRGTLFLDEIGELPLGLQVKMLRALQERQIRRVGGTRQIDVDVRLVSATNRDLRDLVVKGQFREELYYRVNVIPIVLPPLRERKGDVKLLAHTFLKKYAQGREVPLEGFEPEAIQILENYSWPGNVRELQNVIERACVLAEGETISARDLPAHLSAPPATAGGAPVPALTSKNLPLKEAKAQWMTQLEATYLAELLRRHDGNVSQAAKAAGIDRKTFHRLINKYGIRQTGVSR
ncbi:MAG: sigma-54-dependent Fis family transcriptional regulator [Candidatus Rokubacteria bacterium]|nr:sigma-54-dependent Fis family transcriptional regulator [Candidatus Rokubacteria bacterium]